MIDAADERNETRKHRRRRRWWSLNFEGQRAAFVA